MELLLPPPDLLQVNQEVHTAQLATAPPLPPQQPKLNHPPYAKMIVTAIKTLNEKKGSSRKAIAKFIDSTFSNLPVSHAALLTHHLKRLKKKGIVLMVKHSYKLPKSPASTSAAAVASTAAATASSSDPLPLLLLHSNSEQKRGRGRPPKPKPVILSNLDRIGRPKSNSIKRGPGRPSKLNSKPRPKPNPKPKTTGLDKIRRPRGRPRKDASALAAASVSTPVSAALPAPSMAIVPASVLGKRGRGRPRGPPKIRVTPQVKPVKPKRVSKTGRPVGRPKKAKIADGVIGAGVDGNGGSGGVYLIGSDGGVVGGGGELTVVMGGGEKKRGRGRPPKKVGGVIGIGIGIGGGVMKTKRESTGRPVGRPRKMITVETTTVTATTVEITAQTNVNENC